MRDRILTLGKAELYAATVQKKMKGQMNQYIIGPYQKVVDQAKGTSR